MAGLIVIGFDVAAQFRRRFESVEEIARYYSSANALDSVRFLDAEPLLIEHGELGEGLLAGLPRVKIRLERGHIEREFLAARIRHPDVDQALGISIRERADEHRIDQAEN